MSLLQISSEALHLSDLLRNDTKGMENVILSLAKRLWEIELGRPNDILLNELSTADGAARIANCIFLISESLNKLDSYLSRFIEEGPLAYTRATLAHMTAASYTLVIKHTIELQPPDAQRLRQGLRLSYVNPAREVLDFLSKC